MEQDRRNEFRPGSLGAKTRRSAAVVVAVLLAAAVFGVPAQQGVDTRNGTVVEQGASAQRAIDTQHVVAAMPVVVAIEQLEWAFWMCDYASTDRSFQPVDAMACSVVTEDLKKRRFGGDFDAMYTWWQGARVTAHRAIEAAGGGRR